MPGLEREAWTKTGHCTRASPSLVAEYLIHCISMGRVRVHARRLAVTSEPSIPLNQHYSLYKSEHVPQPQGHCVEVMSNLLCLLVGCCPKGLSCRHKPLHLQAVFADSSAGASAKSLSAEARSRSSWSPLPRGPRSSRGPVEQGCQP